MQKRLTSFAQWLTLGVLVGVLSGSASALFLTWLYRVTSYRIEHPVIIWGLPLAGFLMGWIYQRFGREIIPGNNLVLERLQSSGPALQASALGLERAMSRVRRTDLRIQFAEHVLIETAAPFTGA